MTVRANKRPCTITNLGFTLVEILVALAIFATVSTTIYTRTGDSIYQLQSLERKTIAHWLAKDSATLTRLEIQVSREFPNEQIQSRTQFMANREWRIENEIANTDNEWVRRLEVRVFLLQEGEETGPLDTYVTFLGKR